MATPWRPHLLQVFFSNRFVYASILHKTGPSDPGHYVAHASTSQKALKNVLRASDRPTADTAASAEVGRLLAERARSQAGVDEVHFERPKGMRYAGKLKALVDAIRANGVQVK